MIFLDSRRDKRIKYCSKECREKDWIKNNKARDKFLKKKSWIKCHPVICRNCGNIVSKSKRKNGLVFCSEKCRKIIKFKNGKKYYNKQHEIFKRFKQKTGCCICGYNKYSGALDFHHINPEEKEIRITGKHFCSGSEKITREISKCMLLCKNCHYELEDDIKKDRNKYFDKINKVKNNLLNAYCKQINIL